MKSLFKNSLFLLSVCLTIGCKENIVYYSYQPLPEKGWSKNDTLSFQIRMTDSIPSILHLFAEVRNRTDYPYRNLFLFISSNFPDSTIWRTDTLEISLVDEKGKWKGNGWGSLYVSTFPMGKEEFRYPGRYIFKIAHGMKDEKLTGLNDIGIRIEK